MAGKAGTLLVAIILLSAIIIGSSAFVGDVTSNYGVNSTSFGFLNKSAEIAEKISKLGNASVRQPTKDELGSFNSYGILETISIAGSSVDLISTIVHDASDPSKIGEVVPIPDWLPGIITAILLVMVIVTIALAIFRVDI